MTGNVSYYAVLSNVVAYNNNIGIDFTGWEDDGKRYDYARYGIVRGNIVHDIHSEPGNPDCNSMERTEYMSIAALTSSSSRTRFIALIMDSKSPVKHRGITPSP
jgi:hypothetical protein